MKFNDRLLNLRKQKGWSQEELGYKLDVSRQTVSKWEAGQTTPELEKLRNLAKIFEITVDELISDENDFYEEENQKNKIESIKSRKKSKCRYIIIYFFIILILLLMSLVIYRYNLLLEMRELWWGMHIGSNYDYYLERRNYESVNGITSEIDKTEYFYYDNGWNGNSSEQDAIMRLKVNEYENGNLLEPSKITFVDDFWITGSKTDKVLEIDNLNRTYKRYEGYDCKYTVVLVKAEYESAFGDILSSSNSSIATNLLIKALDFKYSISKKDGEYFISNETANKYNQEDKCSASIRKDRIILNKTDYDEEMRANYSVTSYKWRIENTEPQKSVEMIDLSSYAEILE